MAYIKPMGAPDPPHKFDTAHVTAREAEMRQQELTRTMTTAEAERTEANGEKKKK